MTSISPEEVARQNEYLLRRKPQLEGDLVALSAEAERLRRMVERLFGRTAAPPSKSRFKAR